jgi:1,4-dihydroxy-2-naphthoate octaprenyltransferase
MTLRKVWAFVKLTRPLFLGGGVILNLLGVAVAASQGFSVDWAHVLLGQILITSIQLMTHYGNEYYDYEVDRLVGDNRTPFSGGSGVLATGQLDRRVALRAMRVCMGIAIVALILCGLQSPLMWIIGTLALLGAYFYSAPPLSLMGSGWGELNTAILTAFLVPLTGYVMQTGRFDPIVLMLCLPFVLIYFAMVLTFEFPDYAADRAVGKRNIAVRLGLSNTARLHNLLVVGGFGLMAIFIMLNRPVPAAQFVWLALPLAVWQVIGVMWRSRRGWRHFALLSGGAVALAGLVPALWLIGFAVSLSS